MQAIWVKVLQGLRANKNFALFALVSRLDNIEFTAEKIIIPATNDSEFAMLTKHLPYLQQLAGGDYLVIKEPFAPESTDDQEILERLSELFGDRLEVL